MAENDFFSPTVLTKRLLYLRYVHACVVVSRTPNDKGLYNHRLQLRTNKK